MWACVFKKGGENSQFLAKNAAVDDGDDSNNENWEEGRKGSIEW